MPTNNSFDTLTLTDSSTQTNGVGQSEFGPYKFDYLKKEDIYFAVEVSGEWKEIDIFSVDENTKKVTLTATPLSLYPNLDPNSPAGVDGRIYRVSSTSSLVDFQPGSRISEADLDNAYRQALFVGQEVAENSTGSENRTLTNTPDIADGAIQEDKLAGLSVSNAKIAASAVTADKLANTLNLSSKTVTLNSNAISEQAVTQHVSAIKTGINISSGMVGTLPITSGGTGRTTNEALVLETFELPCEAIQYQLEGSRTFTPTAVTAKQDLTDTYSDITGSSVTYTPPSGASIVIYDFKFFVGSGASNHALKAGFKLYLDSDEVTDYFNLVTESTSGFPYGWLSVKHSFRIGEGNSTSTGRVDSWTSNKTIKVQGIRASSSNQVSCHNTFYGDVTTAATERFIRPSISITAIR